MKANNYDMIKRIEALENKTKSILTAGINSNFVISTSGDNVLALDKIICQKGNGFSIKNGKIYVNSDDIKYVKISAMACIRSKDRKNSSLNIYINKNANEEAYAMSTISEETENNQTRSISTKLVQVQKNDYFEFGVYAFTDDYVMCQSQRTYITIEGVV